MNPNDFPPEHSIARIRQRIEVSPSGCWIWTGGTSSGYGRVAFLCSDDGIKRWGSTHRIIYTAERGPIPDGMDLDHQCHDPVHCQPERAADCPHRRCCNPDHLLPMTRQANLLRGGTIPARRSAITHCPAGHAYTPENTLTDRLGRRTCKECTYERNRAYHSRNRERRSAYNKAWRENRAQG